MMMQVNRN